MRAWVYIATGRTRFTLKLTLTTLSFCVIVTYISTVTNMRRRNEKTRLQMQVSILHNHKVKSLFYFLLIFVSHLSNGLKKQSINQSINCQMTRKSKLFEISNAVLFSEFFLSCFHADQPVLIKTSCSQK